MISTCSHKNYNSIAFTTYAISGNRGKDVSYIGKCFPLLAPKRSFWQVWYNNKGLISDDENNSYYIEQFYVEVLQNLDPEEIYRLLDQSILLCYEDNLDFCHRHIVAAWLEILLGIKVPEVRVNGYVIEEIERPGYIKQYLEGIMRKMNNMRGFNSLRALYLFEKGEKLEEEANILEEKTGKSYDHYRQGACFLRCEADEVEMEYNAKKLERKKE